MARPLGSFNSRLKLRRHQDDFKRRSTGEVPEATTATLGYSLGLNRNNLEREETTPSNAEKFVNGRTEANRVSTGMRMAGVELRNQLQQM